MTPDHYVTRLLHTSGVGLAALGVGQARLSEAWSRAVRRILCSHWDVYRGTPVRYWLQAELAEIFDVSARRTAKNADAIYDQEAGRVSQHAYRRRALFERFRIAVLATTDDPCDDLSAQAALAADPTWSARVIPTFRPDRYLDPAAPGWGDGVARLDEISGVGTGEHPAFVRDLGERRRYLVAHGATSADHSHADVRAVRRILDALHPAVAADDEVVAAVLAHAERFEQAAP